MVVDEAVTSSPNLVAGANRPGYHLLHTNYGRDYTAQGIADIALARQGDGCPQCGALLDEVRGVEVGNIFQLGTWYSEALGANFIDADGQTRPVVMGSYGIGSGRLLACIAEAHNDEHGLIWPVSVAPFQVHLVLLRGKKGADPAGSETTADQLYLALREVGIDVLYDDRDESPGVKFNDADLIGLPLRLTVSERALAQGGVEFKRRDRPDKAVLPMELVIEQVQAELRELQSAIDQQVVAVPYKE